MKCTTVKAGEQRWARFEWKADTVPESVGVLIDPDTPNEAELWQRLTQDRMTQPFIFDTGQQRRLHFSWNATQSTLLRLHPNALVSRYTRKMMAFLLMNPTPRRILMLGLGGGELARFCYSQLPRCDITVVEIDPRVIALRDEFQIPADCSRFRVVCADGAQFMRAVGEPVDALLVDAFDRQGIARSLANLDFYQSASRVLTDDGVFAMNFWGAPERYVDNLKPAGSAFGSNLRLVNIPDGNVVVFASRHGLPTSRSLELDHRATRLKNILKLDFPHYLNRLCQGVAIA